MPIAEDDARSALIVLTTIYAKSLVKQKYAPIVLKSDIVERSEHVFPYIILLAHLIIAEGRLARHHSVDDKVLITRKLGPRPKRYEEISDRGEQRFGVMGRKNRKVHDALPPCKAPAEATMPSRLRANDGPGIALQRCSDNFLLSLKDLDKARKERYKLKSAGDAHSE